MPSLIVKTQVETLRRRVLNAVRPLETERVPLRTAHGRILAETVRAPRAYPECHTSAMDGFAVRATDIAQARPGSPTVLAITATIAAGGASGRRLRRGEAVRIMTGAPLPPGADCVIRIEDVSVTGETVTIPAPQKPFHDVRRRGVDMRAGQVVLKPGTTIRPAEAAMLALLDCPEVQVYRRPRVGVLSTGDELGEVGKKRPPGHIPDSNRYGLLALIRSAGCDPVDGGRVGDNPDRVLARLRTLAGKCDFIVTSGGVSAGDYDVIKLVARQTGSIRLYRLPMKPGKPQAFGVIDKTPLFGLPGNPVSSMVVFDFLVRPALRRMGGARQLDLAGWPARAGVDFAPKSRAWEFVRVVATEDDGQWTVIPCRSQRSSDLRSMTDATGYVVLRPDRATPRRGDTVTYTPFCI